MPADASVTPSGQKRTTLTGCEEAHTGCERREGARIMGAGAGAHAAAASNALVLFGASHASARLWSRTRPPASEPEEPECDVEKETALALSLEQKKKLTYSEDCLRFEDVPEQDDCDLWHSPHRDDDLNYVCRRCVCDR